MSSSYKFSTVSYDPFRKGDVQYVVPMTQSQLEIWLSASQNENASRAFNLSICYAFDGKVNLDKIKSVLNKIGSRHEALRASFSQSNQAMVIYKEFSLDCQVLDVQDTNQKSALQQVAEIEKEKCNELFDLVHGPLFKVHVIRTNIDKDFILIIAHHIIADGWSLDLLLNELYLLYNNDKDKLLKLGEPGSIAKYNIVKYKNRQNENFDKTTNYWLGQFKNKAPVLDLPLFKSRPVVRDYAANRVDVCSSSALKDKVDSILPSLGVTFFSLTYSIYLLLLNKLTRQTEITVGVPYAGQVATGEKMLFGHCVNMLPVINRISPSQTILEFIKNVQISLLDAKEHGDITFSDLLGKIQIKHDSSRVPIVATTFNQDDESREYVFDCVNVLQKYNKRDFETFELANTIVRGKDKLKLQCQFNTSLFEEKQIINWIEDYFALFDAVLNNLNNKIEEISAVNTNAIASFDSWNATAQDFPADKNIGQFLTEAAAKYPDKIAVSHGKKTYTFAELEAAANAFAHQLIKLGVQPNSFVGIYVERSAEMLILLLGILKSGAGYLPLDPEYPAERISFIIEDAEATLLVTQKKLSKRIDNVDAEILYQEDIVATIEQYEISPPKLTIDSSALAYTIYTSGSTGKPKGVQVTHRNVVNFLTSMLEKPGLNEKDILLAVTTISFDIHALELYLPLLCAAQIVIADRNESLDGQLLLEKIDRSNITVMQATPSTWRMLLAAGWSKDLPIKGLIGGEALPKDILPKLVENTSELWNMYGPTETTVWSTCKLICDADKPITVGQPIANTQLYVLDEQLNHVPIGAPGELYIGGDGVTLGYLNRPELNKERFIKDKFSSDPQATLYRTGDEVRFRLNGELEYLNRIDNQVKVRGYRIELGEIESVITKHDSIVQCVAMAREDEPGDVRLVAYYSTSTKAKTDINNTLKDFVSQSLPYYMVPQHFIELNEFPLTPNGKIDRKQLPQPDYSQQQEKDNYVAPSGEIEEKIASIWSDLIGIKNIGVFDNFFEIGGHSLLAMKFIIRIKEELDVSLNLQNVLFDSLQNIAQLCGSENQPIKIEKNKELKRSNIQSIFFGEENQLYGIYHPAVGPRNYQSVLICPPVSQEYVRCHKLFRMLSEKLAQKGFDVFRFNFYGTGDSLGLDVEATCQRWRKDIISAVNYLNAKHEQPLNVFAGRIGASLFLQLNQIEYQKALLWDPILDGESHITRMQSLQKNILKDFSYYRWGKSSPISKSCSQYSSFNYSDVMLSEIKNMKFNSLPANVEFVTSSDYFEVSELNKLEVKNTKLKANADWYNFMRQEDIITMPDIIHAVTKHLVES